MLNQVALIPVVAFSVFLHSFLVLVLYSLNVPQFGDLFLLLMDSWLVLVVLNKAAVNVLLQVCLWVYIFISLWRIYKKV